MLPKSTVLFAAGGTYTDTHYIDYFDYKTKLRYRKRV